jgi:hypothetical protein
VRGRWGVPTLPGNGVTHEGPFTSSVFFGPLGGEVPASDEVDGDHDAGGQESADDSAEGIAVGIPFVPLGAEKSHAEIGSKNQDGGPFREFVDHGRGDGEGKGKEITPEEGRVSAHGVEECFAVRPGESESIEEMDGAVVVVSLEAEQRIEWATGPRGEPIVVGDTRIRVVRAYLVEAEEDKNEGIGYAGERKSAVGEEEEEDAYGDHDVFEHPGLAVEGGDAERDDEDEVEKCEERDVAPVRGGREYGRWHSRGPVSVFF